MAKLKVLPAQAVIDGFKGKLDYYIHDGIPCVRRWPRSPGKRRAPAVEAQWAVWKYASQEWSNLSDVVQAAYREQAAGTPLSGRDLFTRSYLSGLFSYPTGGEEGMKTIWLPTSVAEKTADFHNTSVPWTELDLSAYIPSEAKFVIGELIGVMGTSGGGTRLSYQVREPGHDGPVYPTISWWSGVAMDQDFPLAFTVPVDSDRKIEWRLDNPENMNFNLWLYIFGYII